MSGKKLNIFFSFGIGRLHFTNLIPELTKRDLNITIVQGWTPKKIGNIFSLMMDLFFNRKNTNYGIQKRTKLLTIVHKSNEIALPEIIQRFLTRFFSKGKLRGNIYNFTWRLFGRISANFLNESYHVCHIRSGAGYKLIQKAKKLGIPVVVDHSIIHPTDADNNLSGIFQEYGEPIGITLENPFWRQVVNDCQQADVVLVNSFLVKESLERNGLKGKCIEVAYLGISAKFVGKKQNWGLIKEHHLKIIFTGTFNLRKGIKDIFMALEILANKNVAYELHVFGAVVVPEKLMEKKQRLNIIEHGFIPQEALITNLQNSDVYLFPTLAEGAANSLLEAMAVGLPVITTAFSGGPIEHKKNGWLVDINAPEKIAAALMKLMQDEPLRKKLGQSATKSIQELCTWENCTKRVEQVYKRLNKPSS